MDTKTRKRKAVGGETPKGISFSSKRSELLVKSYTKANTSPLKLATKQEMEAREDDEVCTRHGNPIIAFEESDGSTLCEECVFKGHVEKPVFTAVVTKQIKKAFDTEYSTFEKLCEELMSIKQNEVRNRIQESVTLYFDSIRDKIDELEEKTVAKIENSKNLNDLVGILEETHNYMEQN